VSWAKVTWPVDLGGLGVLDLAMMGYALRLRWEWLARSKPDRLWAPLSTNEEKIVHAMFQASMTVQVGSRARALFWIDRWLDGASIDQITPDVFTAVSKRTQKTQTV
jgi:hypothetical protein